MSAQRRRPTWRGSLAPDVHALLSAMPGDASRFVDEAIRALAAARGITVATLREARERFESDPIGCALCAAEKPHNAVEHRAALDASADEWRTYQERETRRAGRIVSDEVVTLRATHLCDCCGAARFAGDTMRTVKSASAEGFATSRTCYPQCQSVTGSVDDFAAHDREWRSFVGGHR